MFLAILMKAWRPPLVACSKRSTCWNPARLYTVTARRLNAATARVWLVAPSTAEAKRRQVRGNGSPSPRPVVSGRRQLG